MRTFIATFAAFVAVSAPFVVSAGQTPTPPPAKPIAAERLSMPLFPGGWIEAHTQRGAHEIVEYVPEGQTAKDWAEKIRIEVYYELNSLPVDTLQRRAVAQTRDACTGVVEGKLQTGLNNGYPSGFWTMGCKRDRQTVSGFSLGQAHIALQ